MARALLGSLSVLFVSACALPHAGPRGDLLADSSVSNDVVAPLPDVSAPLPDAVDPVDTGACASSQTLCSGACVDLRGDRLNCGACGRECAAGQLCAAGQCAADCGAQTLCSGACVDLASNAMHCGACGRACPAGQVCAGSMCRCGGATPDACGVSCVNLQGDSNNCGACGRVCPNTAGGTTSCSMGTCGSTCPAATHLCGATCVADNSVDQCGPSCVRCDRPATNGAVACNSGRCVITCAAGYMLMGTSCVPMNTTCGNGALDSGEGCDDRNVVAGDGCSASCQLESGVVTRQCSGTRTPLQISLNQTIRLRSATSSAATSTTDWCNGMNRATGPEAVFEVRLLQAGRLRTTVTPNSSWDIVLKGGVTCPGECLDNNPAAESEGPAMTMVALPAGTTFYLIVDGYTSRDAGEFTLETSLVP